MRPFLESTEALMTKLFTIATFNFNLFRTYFLYFPTKYLELVGKVSIKALNYLTSENNVGISSFLAKTENFPVPKNCRFQNF